MSQGNVGLLNQQTMLNDPGFVQIFVQVFRCYPPVPGPVSYTHLDVYKRQADILSEYARRILVLEKGRLCIDAPAEEVFRDMGKIEKYNLDVSRPRKIAHLIQQQGLPFPQDIIRYGELFTAIKTLVESRCGK